MKYKDRTHAKRKYKQALLATVATMTLGVSTLGSTSSAFAEEKDTNATQQQNTVQQKSAGTYYEAAPTNVSSIAAPLEKTIELLKNQKFANAEGKQVSIFDGNKYITPDFLKGSISTTGLLLKQIYSDAYSKDFNNAARELSVSLVSLIPYGGSIASPILGLIWPENVDNSQMKKIEKLIGSKISEYDVNTLKAKYNTLVDRQTKYENSMVETDIAKDTRKTNAINADNAFIALINESNKKDLELAELPVYTTAAAAHITFLQAMQVQQTREKAGIDSGTFNANFNSQTNNLADNIATYTKHIQDVYDKREKEIFEQIANIVKRFGGSESINIYNYETILTEKYNAIKANKSGSAGIERLKDDLIDAKSQCDELNTELQKLYNETLGNEAFLTVTKGHKVQENNKWYFIDTQGKKKTGWLQLGKKWYYFKPETGDMVTGKIDIDGKTYFFKPETGEMSTGWVQDGDKYYYVSPVGGFKNWNGDTFKSGDLVTGWLQVDSGTYYLSPADDAKNNNGITFNKGEMMTGWVAVAHDGKSTSTDPSKYGGAWYYFDDKENLNFQGKLGRML
ncbi:insecticidal delta-endotoxin Cry8Ea1 family protein, partial [Bacillus thuringiensis]